MEPALKQRLIGAMVLVALAVIFLPMLINGPAPTSGASDVSLTMPATPRGDFETRELPLVTPGQAPAGGALGMDAAGSGQTLPTVDTTAPDTAPTASSADADNDARMLPAATAGGNYVVSFGSYASSADAARVIAALASARLPGYQEPAPGVDGRSLHRVRVGPFASQAEAEAARLGAARIRDDVGAKVIVLDSQPAAPLADSPAAVAKPVAPVASPQSAPAALPRTAAPAKPDPAANTATEVAKTVDPPKPAATVAPATAGVGFAVQLGAFASTVDAGKLRDRARAAGFSAFVQDVRTDKGTLSRVRVGPVASRADAEEVKAQVSAKLGISGIVQSHP